MYRFILFLTLGIFFVSNLFPQSVKFQVGSNSEVSLLTCSPNIDAVYSFFGHSAIRVKDDSLNIDYVFDYGVFDFNSNNFIYRFIKGETDYMVMGRLFENFRREYIARGAGVYEQILNLSYDEKKAIVNYLFWNVQPANRVYRYNFVENNCSTKLRDIVVETVKGNLCFKEEKNKQTYRDLLNEDLVMAPWYRMGINVIIGSAADTTITMSQKDFIPQYLFNSFESATINDTTGCVPLVKQTRILLKPSTENETFVSYINEQKQTINSPLYWGIILVIMSLIVSVFSYSRNKKILVNLFDTILFSVSTLCGCIVFYLMFFSLHPCVGANWNLVWLNPLFLLFLPLLFTKSWLKYIISYHFINFALLTLFFVFMYFIPQAIDYTFLPFIFVLWFRSGMRILIKVNTLK